MTHRSKERNKERTRITRISRIIKGIGDMTVLEQRFMETVPSRLKGIEEQMKRIADALEKLAETNNESK